MAEYTTTARPYARAVFDVASKSATLESWSEALALMAAVAVDAAMQAVLDNPELGKVQKGEMMLKVVAADRWAPV